MTTPDTRPPHGDEDLSAAERRLLDAVTTGAPVDLRTGDTGRTILPAVQTGMRTGRYEPSCSLGC